MPDNLNPLGAKRVNAFIDDLVRLDPPTKAFPRGKPAGLFYEMVDFFVEELMADGYPAFTGPHDNPYLDYLKLSGWRMANDPRYTQDPVAEARLNELSLQYGQPAQLSLNPLQGQTVASPMQQARASSGVSRAQWQQSQPPGG